MAWKMALLPQPGTFNLSISNVNDVPVNTVPGPQSINEDTSLAIGGISVNDVDGNLSTVQLSVSNGNVSVSLSGTASITAGNNDSNTLTLSGTQADINTALASLTYQGNLHFNGSDTLTVLSTDSNSATDSKTVTITVNAVNDEQSLDTNAGLTLNEAATATLTNTLLASSDIEQTATQIVYTVGTAPANGILKLSGSNLLATSTFTQDDIDNNRITYVHDGGETTVDSFDFNVDDGLGTVTSATFNITVTPINDSPSIAINTGAAVSEGGSVTLSATHLNEGDVDDSGAGLTYSVTTGPANGQLELTSSPGVAINSFTQDDIDNNRLIYVHNGSQTSTDNFDFTLADGLEDGAVAATGTFNLSISNVNDVPVNTVPGPQSINEDTSLAIGGISVNDVDGNLSTVQLSVSNGNVSVSLSGTASITAGNNDSNTLTLSGTQADINTALASLTYQGNLHFNGSDTLTVLSTDSNSATDSKTVTITVNAVNDEQSLDTNAGLTLNEAATATLTNTLLASSDIEQTATQIVYTVGTAPANGILKLSGSNLLATSTFTQDDIDNNRITYVHDGGETTVDSFDFNVDDGLGTVTSATFNITVTPINDSPSIAINTGAAVSEGGSVTLSATHLNEGDVDDSGAGLTYSVTTGPANGQLELTSSPGVAINSFTQDDIDNNRLIYVHNGSQTSTDNFDFTLADGLEDGAVAATGTFNLSISNVNDVPVNTVPGPQSINEDTSLAIGGISVNDVDGNLSTVQLSVSNGNVSVNLSGTASITAGNNNSNTLTLSGTQADINTALASLTYQGNTHFNGSDTLTVLSTDSDSATDSKTIAITVNAVNDDPTDINLSNNSVNQSTGINALIGALSGTDADIGSSHTFSLVVGVGDINNALFQVSGTSLLANNATTMAAGIYSARIEIDDNDGGTFEKVFSITIVDDLVPAPTITLDNNITADDIINAAEALGNINISGTVAGEVSDGDTVTLTVNGNTFIGAVNSGTFSIAVTGTDLVADGDSTIDASISHTDTAGNTGSGSDTESYSVDTSAPAAPVITGINNDSDTTIINGVTNDNTLLIAGTAEANNSIEVFIDGISIGIIIPDGSGNWRIDHTDTILADGSYVLTSQATDHAGNSSPTSAGFDIIIDTSTPVTSDEADPTELFGILPDDENMPVDQAPISSLDEILPPENSDSSFMQNEGETTLQESFNNSLPELSEYLIYEEDKDLYERTQYESKKYTPFVPQSFTSFLKYIHSTDMGSAPDLNGLTMGDDTSVSDDLWKNIELMRSQIDLSEKAGRADSFKVEYVAGASISFTAGIVSWVLRGGSLMASFLSSVPVFRNFDPLPIATSKQKASDDKKNNADHEQSPQKTASSVFDDS